MTYNNLQDNNSNGIELNATVIRYEDKKQERTEKLNASVVNFADKKKEREVIQGKADISNYSIENVQKENIEIPVGDMQRDGIQPPQAEIKALEERHAFREKLKGRERTGTDR